MSRRILVRSGQVIGSSIGMKREWRRKGGREWWIKAKRINEVVS